MADTLDPQETSRAGAVVAALHYRDFRWLWASMALSNFARWAMVVAQGWFIYDVSGSSTLVGVGTLASFTPFVLAPLLGGPLADRFDRKKLTAVTYGVSFLVVAALALLVFLDLVRVWHVIAATFLVGISRSVEQPATQALLPNVVPRETLLNALALSSLSRHGARLAGPAAAGPLLLTVGAGGAFAAAAAASGLAVFLVLAMRISSRGQVSQIRLVFHNFYNALQFLYRHPSLALIMGLVAGHCALTMSYEAVLPRFSDQVLAGGGGTYSALFMAVGAGSVIATLYLASIREERPRGRWLLLSGIFSGAAPIALGLTSSYGVALVLAGIMGAAQSALMALTNAFILEAVPDAVRGRMSSLYNMHAGGVMGFANLANGQVADQFGAPVAFIATGTLFLLVLLLLARVGPNLRAIFRTGVVPRATE